MSAEELPKPIDPRIERALERLAKTTLERGWDPVRVVMALQKAMEVWNSLTPEQRIALKREIRRMGYPRVGQERKPRKAGQ